MTRRTALRTAAGAGTALAASRGLPAWARPIADATAVKGPGSRPFPGRPEGTVSMPQIEHIVVVMMENHSFDNVLGMLPHRVRSRRKVDGLPVDRHGRVTASQRDAGGHAIRATRFDTPCQLPSLPNQDWNDSHIAFNGGRMDGFVRASGPIAMRFYDQSDLPFTYGLAARFPIGERYFQSCLAQTYPNRRFLFAGTASGTIATLSSELGKYPPPNGTIFDRLDQQSIPWAVYYENLPSPDIIPNFDAPELNRNSRILKIDQFYADAAAGRLPAFTFLDPDYDTTSEENPQNIQVGEQFVHDVVTAVMHAPTWSKTALFLTYDEHGGYYDHVPPPRAIKPDSTEPRLAPGDIPGSYDRYGFRVPFVVVSPWARPNYASRIVQDHTSILRFIERKWNLGAMTFRDANAADLTDYFDFRHAAFAHPPALPAAPPLAPGLVRCRAHGLFPKLPPGVTE
jgi:phospholipase C